MVFRFPWNRTVLLLLVAVFSVSIPESRAASLVDLTFDVRNGPGATPPNLPPGPVRAITVQPDGRILVGGEFTAFNDVPCDGLARLETNGAVDTSFKLGSGKPASVWALAVQATGEIVVGGAFDTFYGQPCDGLIRLKSDGSLDDSFVCSSNNFGAVTALRPQANGKILVGALQGVYQILQNGQLDPEFAITAWTNAVVGALLLQADGKILAGGPALNFGYRPGTSPLIRLNQDGSSDPSFFEHIFDKTGPDSLSIDSVTDLISDAAGRILASGNFSVLKNGQRQQRLLVRLNSDGTLDSSFPLESSQDWSLGPTQGPALLAGEGGRVFLGTGAMTIDGVGRSMLAQVSIDGVLNVNFAPEFSDDSEPFPADRRPYATALALQPDGKVLVAGRFTAADGIPRMGLVRVLPAEPTDLNVVSIGVPRGGLTVFEGNTKVAAEIIRAGDPTRRVTVDYSTVNETAVAGQDFVGINGTLTFEPGERKKTVLIEIRDDSTRETNETCRLVLVNPSERTQLGDHANEKVTIIDDDEFRFGQDQYFVDESSSEIELAVIPGQEQSYTVAYDTTEESARAFKDFAPKTGELRFSSWWQDYGFRMLQIPIFDDPVMEGDRSFLVTVRNSTSGLPLGPESTARVTIMDNDTLAGPAKGVNGTITTASESSDGNLIVGGWFTAVDGLRRNYIARLRADGSADPSFDPGRGPDGPVTVLCIQTNGQLLIGGQFTEVSGASRRHLARLNLDGSLDTTFDPGTGWEGPIAVYDEAPSIRAIVLQPDGKIITAGNFSNYNGVLTPCLARLNPDGARDLTFNPKLDRPVIVRCAAVQTDRKIVIAGRLANGDLADKVIRLNADGSIDETFTTFAARKILSLLIRGNGKILVGAEGSPGVTLLNIDGTPDPGWKEKTFFGETVFALSELPDGKILAGGQFWNSNPDPSHSIGLIRLFNSGGLDPSFIVSPQPVSLAKRVRTVVMQKTGEIFIGGTFDQMDDEQISLARQNPVFGVAFVSRNPGAYFWLRLRSDGAIVNDLRFDRLVRLDNGVVQLSLSGQAAGGFVLERSEDLRNWKPTATNAAPNSGLVFRDLGSTNAPRQFYRVR